MEHLFGDIYNIAGRVKEIDPALTISWTGKEYHVSRNKHRIMTLKPDELDARVLTKLRKGDLQRRRLEDIIYEMERSEDELEKHKAKNLRNKIEAMTLDQYDQLVGIKHFALGGI